MIVFEHSYFDSLLFCFRREKKNGIFFVITRAAAALFETTFDTISNATYNVAMQSHVKVLFHQANGDAFVCIAGDVF